LVNALKELPEFKKYNFRTERSKYLSELGIPLNTDSTTKGQAIFLAERATELMLDDIITDRTIIDVMAFAKCSKSMNYLESQKFCDFASTLLHEYDHIFYVTPKGVDIEDNGVRETDVIYRAEIDSTISTLLRFYAPRIKNLTTIEGSTKERIDRIKEVIFS
jgi:hypothetical protein